MQKNSSFFHKKVLSLFGALVLGLLCIAATAGYFCWSEQASVPSPMLTQDMLYAAATVDAMTIEADEIFPLVCLTPEDTRTQWQDGKVLLATLNKSPERYPDGKTVKVPGEVWVFSAQEMANWYANHKKGVSDWNIRLQQLVGVPLSSQYSHVSAMWVSPADVIRPAYNTDIASKNMPVALPENTSPQYRDWFRSNILWSYFDSRYPWTRIGYTYDWAARSGEYGLTEFLVREGAEVLIAYTETIPEYIARLEKKKIQEN